MSGACLMGVSAQRNTKCSCQTEISQLQVTLTVNQQVLWLEITMKDAMAVAVADAFHHLCHELLDHLIIQTQIGAHHRSIGKSLATAALAYWQGLHVFLQVEIEELKDEVQFVAVCVDNVEQLDNVRVMHFFEQRDLADGGAGNAFIFGLQSDLLQSNYAVGMVQFSGLVDDTVGS